MILDCIPDLCLLTYFVSNEIIMGKNRVSVSIEPGGTLSYIEVNLNNRIYR